MLLETADPVGDAGLKSSLETVDIADVGREALLDVRLRWSERLCTLRLDVVRFLLPGEAFGLFHILSRSAFFSFSISLWRSRSVYSVYVQKLKIYIKKTETYSLRCCQPS